MKKEDMKEGEMDTKTLVSWITRWNPHCEHITLSTIFAKMRFERGTSHVINGGPPGTGKSRSSLELIKALDLGSEIILDNTTTDKGLFETFMNYPEQDIILDECSTLLKSLKTQDMVKLAMEGKPLNWTKDGAHLTTPAYKGNLLINSNVLIADTVVDRSLVNKSMMNKEMTLSFNELFVNEWIKPTDFTPFIAYIKKVVTDKKPVELTNDEVKKVLDFTQKRIEDLEDGDFSRRIIIREINYFRRAKKLFGKLDDEVLTFIEPYAETYIANSAMPGLIESILGSGPIDKIELVRRVAHEGGYSERHARRLVDRDIEDGTIELRGKMVSLRK